MLQLTLLDDPHRPAFEQLLREMWQQNWRDELATAIVQWRYYNRPTGAATWLAMDQDRCVGMLDSMLRPYLLNGQRILVRETADWYCMPQQRAGLGLRLLRHLNMYSEPVFVLGGSSSTLNILSKMREWSALPSASSYVMPLKARGLVANIIRQRWWQHEALAQMVPNFLPLKRPRRIDPPAGQHGTTRLLTSFDISLPKSNGSGLIQLFESDHWAWLTKMPPELARPIGVQFFLNDKLVGLTLSQIEPAATGLDAKIMYMQVTDPSCTAWMISETTQILAEHNANFVRCCVSTPNKISAMQAVGYIKTRDVACHWWSQSAPTPIAVDIGYLRGDDAIPFQALRGRMTGVHG